MFNIAPNEHSESARISSLIIMPIGSWEIIKLKAFESKLVLFRGPCLSKQNNIKVFEKLSKNIIMPFILC